MNDDTEQTPQQRYQAVYNSIKWDDSFSFFIVEHDSKGRAMAIDRAFQKKCGDAAIMAIATSIEKFKDACKKAGL
jgi:hypothetical protein